ncbi:MAG: hypothetical protein ACI4AM_03000 [Muribaculaceae bacterium]
MDIQRIILSYCDSLPSVPPAPRNLRGIVFNRMAIVRNRLTHIRSAKLAEIPENGSAKLAEIPENFQNPLIFNKLFVNLHIQNILAPKSMAKRIFKRKIQHTPLARCVLPQIFRPNRSPFCDLY